MSLMHRSAGKQYIKKDKKWSVIFTLSTIAVVLIIIAVIELLPNRVPELGYSDMNGVGRSFMFPFVFQDDKSNLYVMQADYSVRSIDDTVEKPVHDSANEKIYYIKNKQLYEYSLKGDHRVALCDGVSDFHLIGNRRAIICTGEANELLLYLFKGDQTQQLNTPENQKSNPVFVASAEGVLFADGNHLIYSDYMGKTHTITEQLNSSKKFYLSEDGNQVCYYEGDALYLADIDGNKIEKMTNGQPVVSQKEPVLLLPSTGELDSNGGVPFRYFLDNINISSATGNAEETYTTGDLQYFTGSTLKEIAKDIYRVIYYSEEDDFILYSVLNDTAEMELYMSAKGGKPEKQISCDINDKFIFDDKTNYLYYQEPDGALYRYNIYDVKRKTARITERSDNIFNYYNKPFIAYDDIHKDETYLLLKNKIERMQSNLEKRLYGRSNELFLLCRQNETGQMTIDYVVEDQMKRITNNAGANVFFDRDLEYLVYNDGGGLYVWHDGAASYAGEYRDIKAVDITK